MITENDFVIENGVLLKYNGNDSDVLIPDGVTEIGCKAFKNCENLKSVEIPNSVKDIGRFAFKDCINLTNITLPDGLKVINQGVFENCENLKSIIIPNDVITIDEFAFRGCASLINISIPNSVKNIGMCAFESCGLTDVSLPNSLAVIEYGVFSWCTNLKNISIPSSVEEIKSSAFKNCRSLNNIEFPNSVKKIGYETFSCCGLSMVVLPANTIVTTDSFSPHVDVYKVGEGPLKNYNGSNKEIITPDLFVIENEVLQGYLGRDEEIVIPDGVKVIDSFAFTNKTCVKSIKLSNSVKEIKTNAFYACTGLCSLYISASVEKIEPGIATSQEGELTIESIEVDENNKYYSSLDGNLYNKEKTRIIQYAVGKKDRFFSIPESVTSIEDEAFWSAINLTEVKIPNGVVTIGRDAFRDCYSLSKISIPDSVQEIGDQVFTCCSNLEIIEIGSGLQKTGSLYEECYEIKHVFIKDVAKYCSNDIDYPCNSYGYNLYLNGELIKELVIPEGVSVIKSCAFCACDSIEKVILPNSLSKIEQSAFTGDKEGFRLDVYYNGTEEEWSKVEIEDDNDYLENAKVHFNYKSKQEKISACKEKVDISPNNDVLFKVSTLLCSRVPEKEILSKLKGENIPDKDIVESVFKLDNDSTMAESFCSKVIEPKVVELLKTGYSVGEVLNNMYKKYPRGLVNRSMVNVLCNEYLTY